MIILTSTFCSVSCDVSVITPNVPDLARGHTAKHRHTGAKENKTKMIVSSSLSLNVHWSFIVRIIKYRDK